MKLPRHPTLRAISHGTTAGIAIGGSVFATGWLFGDAGLIGLAVLAGPGLLLPYVLERRAKRAQKEPK